MNEAVDFPVPFPGEQAVRSMADGEVVAYRINRDYLSVGLTGITSACRGTGGIYATIYDH